jgi:hypothetical protein
VQSLICASKLMIRKTVRVKRVSYLRNALVYYYVESRYLRYYLICNINTADVWMV